VSLLVVRAQGVVGDISAEWRTRDGTARSAGRLHPDFLVSHFSCLKQFCHVQHCDELMLLCWLEF